MRRDAQITAILRNLVELSVCPRPGILGKQNPLVLGAAGMREGDELGLQLLQI